MENNAIMQRVFMLSEIWKKELVEYPDVRVFCFTGSSSIEYKTIKGFVLFQTSFEKTLDDLIINLQHPFNPSENQYGVKVIEDLDLYFQACLAEPNYKAQLDGFEWRPRPYHEQENDVAYFLENAIKLSEALGITGETEHLVFALFPQGVSDWKEWTNWLNKLLALGVPKSIRIMLYDTKSVNFYETLSSKNESLFRYLYPDLDLPGAMHQILEEAKANQSTLEDKDIITFQQNLVKMNEAVGYADEKGIMLYRDECLRLALKNKWKEQEATIYYFMHAYYASIPNVAEGIIYIDSAIKIYSALIDADKGKDIQPLYHYYIAKANLYLLNKHFKEAIDVYRASLLLPSEAMNPLLSAGIHQMLGNALRKGGTKQEAREVFAAGWSIIEQIQEMPLTNNVMAMFYANDWMEVADHATLKQYSPQFDLLWGDDWQKDLKRNILSGHIAGKAS